MSGKSSNVALMGLCCALALLLAYVEAMIGPIFPSIPGVKMGLPNIVIIFVLYRRGLVSAFTVSLLRIILVSILFGNLMAFLYSLAGGILSLLVMAFLRKFNIFSEVGVSVAGGVTHNVGQILIAMLMLETAELGYYLAVLTVTGTVAGVLIGLCGAILVRKIPRKMF